MLMDLQVVFQVPYHKVHYSGIRHLERLFLLEAPPRINLGETKKIIVELNVDKHGGIVLSEAYGFATIRPSDFDIRDYEGFDAAGKQEYIVRTLSEGIECVLKKHGRDCGWVGRAAGKIRKEGYAGTYRSKPKLSGSRKLKAELGWWYASENCGILAKVIGRGKSVLFDGVLAERLDVMGMEKLLRETHWDGEHLVCAGRRHSFPEDGVQGRPR